MERIKKIGRVKRVCWLLPKIIIVMKREIPVVNKGGKINDILISGRDGLFFWNYLRYMYFMGFKRAYGSHDTGKACIFSFQNGFPTVIQRYF